MPDTFLSPPLKRRLSLAGVLRLAALTFGLTCAGSAFAAAPTITSATTVDLYYNSESPGDVQFAFRVVASGAVSFDATGLPPYAFIDSATGWINGNRDFPGVYNATVRATNAEGSTTATVRFAIHPAVTGVRSSPGTFGSGQVFSFTLRYNAAVVVTGTPRLVLAIGPADALAFKEAIYVSGSGSNELVFQYSVVPGDNDPDGVQVLPSAPSGGTITDASGLAASPSLPVRYFVSGITIKADASLASATQSATDGQLKNVSARLRVVEGDASRSLIAGFVVSGTQSKRVLLRAIGPALTGFGVSGALADPRLRLYSSSGALVVENDNWSGAETSAAATAVGAFALATGADDSAVVVTLSPGAYTLMVSPNGSEGVALAEVYDADVGTTGTSAIINLSTRGQVDGDSNALIAGFNVSGTGTRRVLVRGIGPGLALFGVGGTLVDPTLKIYQDGRLVAQNDDWTIASADVIAASNATGAFALSAVSKDAAIVLTLGPGSYTAVVSGAGNASGAGLVEVYNLPTNE